MRGMTRQPKSILTSSQGVEQKSHPITTSIPMWGGKNMCGAK